MKKQLRRASSHRIRRPTKAELSRAPGLQEFWTMDLGGDVRASGVKPVLVRPKSRMTSILLDDTLIEQLKRAGAKRGLGYQTMLKVIVREHIADY